VDIAFRDVSQRRTVEEAVNTIENDHDNSNEDEDVGRDADLPQSVRDVIEAFAGRKGDHEDETIITRSKTDVHVWSSIGSDVVKIARRVGMAATSVHHDAHGAWFTVPLEAWRGPHGCFKVGGGAKRRRTMTDEQRQAASDRLAKARAARAAKADA
jgi:hypothetical protein